MSDFENSEDSNLTPKEQFEFGVDRVRNAISDLNEENIDDDWEEFDQRLEDVESRYDDLLDQTKELEEERDKIAEEAAKYLVTAADALHKGDEEKISEYIDRLDSLADSIDKDLDDLEDVADEGTATETDDVQTGRNDVVDELESQRTSDPDGYYYDDGTGAGCEDDEPTRRGFLGYLVVAGLASLGTAVATYDEDDAAAPPSDNGDGDSPGTPGEGESPPGQDGTDEPSDPSSPEPDNNGETPDNGDPSNDRPDYHLKETWISELENMAPSEYSDKVEDDSVIKEICEKYQISEFEKVASIGEAAFKDSNDIVLDEEGDNVGENLALAWWDRSDMKIEAEYELPDDIEGIVALTDWQTNVYEFGILGEEEYDFALDTAQDLNNEYSLQNSGDALEYLAGGIKS